MKMELFKRWHYLLLVITCGTVFMNAGKYDFIEEKKEVISV